MSKIALVTGATAGFGRAIARKLADEGWSVIVNGRRVDRLVQFAEEYKGKGELYPLAFDVRKVDEVEKALERIPERLKAIDVLVNNAGLAVGRETIDNGDLEDWNRMIDTNVKGLLIVTRAVVQRMKAARSGHVVNIGSIAGKEVYAGGNVYCATKFAVDALTKAMRVEFLPLGVKVTQVSPGAAETEFSLVRYKGDAEKAEKVYDGYQPLRSEDIADTVWFVLSRPEHVCLNDIVIMPAAQANSFSFHKTK